MKIPVSLALLLVVASTFAATEMTVNAFCTLRVDSSAVRTIVAVPWIATGLENGAIKVKDVVKTDNLTNGDTLSAYDQASGKYETWMLFGGRWVAAKIVSETGVSKAPDEELKTLERGSALMLIRQDTTKPFYLCGQASATLPSVSITCGASESPVYNLMAPPFAKKEDLDINTCANWSNVSADDRIFLPNASGALSECKWVDGQWKKWASTGMKVVGGVNVRTYEWVSPDTLPSGTGFWYVSKSSPAPTVAWVDAPEANN